MGRSGTQRIDEKKDEKSEKEAEAEADKWRDAGIEWGPSLRKEPHVGDVNGLRMFPSDKVVLSCGGDLVLGVWDLASGRRAATLRGHRRGVLSAAIIDRGRNVVSSAGDGTVKLWEIASQTVIRDLYVSPEDPTTMLPAVNCVWVAGGYTHSSSSASSAVAQDPREVGTGDKLVLAALEAGGLCGLDPRVPKAVVFKAVNAAAATTACCACSGFYVCGTETGEVYAYDPRNTAEPLGKPATLSGAAISGLRPTDSGASFWVATKDGHLWLQEGTAAVPATVVATYGYEPITCMDTYDGGQGVVVGLKDGGVLVYDFA